MTVSKDDDGKNHQTEKDANGSDNKEDSGSSNSHSRSHGRAVDRNDETQERLGQSTSSLASDYSVSENPSDMDHLSPRKTKTPTGLRLLPGNLLRSGDQNNQNKQSHLHLLIRQRKARQRYMSDLLRVRNTHTGSISQVSGDELEAGRSHFLTLDDNDVEEGDDVGDQRVHLESRGIPKPAGVSSVGRYQSEDTIISSVASSSDTGRFSDILTEEEKEELRKEAEGLLFMGQGLKDFKHLLWQFPVEVRLSGVTFSVPFYASSAKIKTVYNSSFLYNVVRFFKQIRGGHDAFEKEEVHHKRILDDISLSLKPGKLYLLLGPPGSGRSSLLKAIAGRLQVEKKAELKGSVTYNGTEIKDQTEIHIENAISFVAQLDRHAPRYTVEETFQFAFDCKRRYGHHVDFRYAEDTIENRRLAKEADEANLMVNVTMKYLGIDHVADTFVGDGEIRGVSGGQRRRVTIGEMLMTSAPIFCGDEISNGLDASSTYDIVNVLMHSGKVRKRLQVISLLQPSPETVSLFDEVILIAEGKLLFAGPIQKVEDYFASLGYKAPVHLDIADFLQLVSTPEGATLFNPPPEIVEIRSTPYTIDELADEFKLSKFGRAITSDIREAYRQVWGSQHGDVKKLDDVEFLDDRRFKDKYANTFGRSTLLNLRRQLTLWKRDKRVLIANTAKNIIMGISVGGVFFQTSNEVSILGALFQAMLFVMLGGMVTAPAFVDERMIFYKQADANFFSAFPFVFAKAISKLPQVRNFCHG